MKFAKSLAGAIIALAAWQGSVQAATLDVVRARYGAVRCNHRIRGFLGSGRARRLAGSGCRSVPRGFSRRVWRRHQVQDRAA